jgi:site-specific DNA-methyltransferase (adenine-specific)
LSQADCEIAWTNLPGQSRIFEFKWNGMLQEDMKNKEQRIHPTQKPVALYEWILNKFAKPGDIILDMHVGSASSLIACRHTGHKYVGFEIDKYYYKIASERLKAEEQQMNIFDFMGEQNEQNLRPNG